MKTFYAFWYGLKPGAEREDFAARCESTVGYLNLVAGNHAKAGESLAIRIERESDRAVLVETLRPDVDWAVIRNSAA